ncbi:MAG: Na/Pi cotransporter family protein [Alphaproteobacteria bacterium]|jgi:phosphate:Na+ symporter|nr:Na/Pi cotransporter family protein [Alphaproteobacteria bacterium]MDP6621620.1 Na/Pi cotransporter family protein [Alphaproteobacteria bacterium]|tara:strand:- start:370 stop:2028 length:1659 start_codon:yes stop_codon:yes gene_type:complete
MGGSEILLNVAGGVALLLWGSRMVRTGFQRAYGADLRGIIRAGTGNRLVAALAGMAVTTLLQSSTATALMVASFAAGGLMATAPALAVMLGADVGTTLVAQVLSFDLGWLSPLLILAGLVAFFTGRRTRQRDLGRVAIGLGLLLLALKLILAAGAPLREAESLHGMFLALAREPLLALLIAALLTWLAHSSLAMVLLVMSLVASAALPLQLGFALVLGANLGGVIPPIMSTLGQPPEGRRVALGNALFRLIGCLAVLPAMTWLAPLVAAVESDPVRQIANFHTAFNLGLLLVFLPLTGVMAKICGRLLPTPPPGRHPTTPRYLDRSTLDEPSVALSAAAREALRIGDIVETMFGRSLEVLRGNDRKLRRTIQDMDDVVDSLYEQVKHFLIDASKRELDETQSRRYVEILGFTTNLEHIGDIIDNNLMDLAAKKIKHKLSFSAPGMAEIEVLHSQVVDAMQLCFSVFMSGDAAMARRLVAGKTEFRGRIEAASESHLDRLRSERLEAIETSSLHLDVLRDLKRIHSHLVATAYPILEQTGELRSTRLKENGGE